MNKKDKKKFKKYWRLLEPKSYVDKMASNIRFVFAGKKEEKLKGVLKQNKSGFVYLDIPKSAIDAYFYMLDTNDDKIVKPPKNKGVGAHISVIKSKEIGDNVIKELGKEFSFSPGKIVSVDDPKRMG